ncbi:MAG: hypothetical protein L3J04_02505 [Robiginitomaculum sp.]|nr:hypothetical protein [Robiginitomaculum sp.]
MQYQLNIHALKAIFTSLVIVVISLGFAFPVQALVYDQSSIQSMEITDQACSKDSSESHHTAETDCCDKQPCPQDMDCGIDCVAHSVGATALLKTYLPSLHQDKSEVIAPIVLASYAYLLAFDAPPPRN